MKPAGLLSVLFFTALAQEPTLPPSLETLFTNGVAAEKAGKLNEAEKFYLEVLERGGKVPFVYNNLGTVYQQRGEYAKAITQFREAVRRQPGYYTPRLLIGSSLIALGEPSKAVDELQKALQIKPGDSEARLLLARAYQRSGNPLAALDQVQILRKAAPENPEYVYEFGIAYQNVAIWCFGRMRDKKPASARVQQLLGESYLIQGKTALAIQAYTAAVQADQTMAQSHLALAHIHARTGRIEDALKEIEAELIVAPGSAAGLSLKRRLESPKQ